MQIPPPSVRAAWPKPNYVNPVTRGSENVIVNIVLFSFLICFTGLRIFTRTHLRRAFGGDDVLILLAVIPTTAFFIISVLADTHFLWIRHEYDIPFTYVSTGLKMVLSAMVMFAVACTLTKLSMLLLVRRMLANSSLFWRRITLLAIAIVTIQGSVFLFTVIFQCRPPQDYWKISKEPQPNCINQGSTLLVAGIINTLTDFLVVLLPIRTLWVLQIPRRQQIFVIMIFALGFMSCGAGVARTYYLYEVTQTWDQVWASYPVWMSSGIELYVGVICASIPATRPFFSTYLPQIFGTISAVSSSPYNHQSEERTKSVTTGSDGEELMDFEIALAMPRRKEPAASSTATTIRSRGDSKVSDEDSDYIKITQVVEVSDK